MLKPVSRALLACISVRSARTPVFVVGHEALGMVSTVLTGTYMILRTVINRPKPIPRGRALDNWVQKFKQKSPLVSGPKV